jgi:hypothetical protein
MGATAAFAASVADDSGDLPTTVVLVHPIFHRFTDLHFRKSEGDGTPVLVVHLSDVPATLPLRSVQREFHIPDDSPDGIVLGLVAEALEFIGVLRLGDQLPPEVLSGKASWEPEARHREMALARLRLQLVAWITGQSDIVNDPARLGQLAGDPQFRERVVEAFDAAARELGLPRREDAMAMLESLADELAHIEFLREHLMGGLARMQATFRQVLPLMRGDRARADTAIQVNRLLGVAVDKTRARFIEVDAHTSEVLSALKNIDSQVAFIRSTRNFLYRSWLAFEPLVRRWLAIDPLAPQGLRSATDEAWRFLAPRFMAVQDWLEAGRARERERPKQSQMEW